MSLVAQFLIAATLIAVFMVLRLLSEHRVAKDRELHAQSDEKCRQIGCTAICDRKQE